MAAPTNTVFFTRICRNTIFNPRGIMTFYASFYMSLYLQNETASLLTCIFIYGNATTYIFVYFKIKNFSHIFGYIYIYIFCSFDCMFQSFPLKKHRPDKCV